MYLPVPPQPDCAAAWRAAVGAVDSQSGHSAYNVIIDVVDPTVNNTRQDPRIAVVDDFLGRSDKSVEAVANTIFPAGLYYRYGAPAFFDVFRDKVLPKVRRNERWSGYYFERMMQYPAAAGAPPNQLWDIVGRIRDENVRALNKFELSLFDPVRDVDGSPYGGQCLSFLSFKILAGARQNAGADGNVPESLLHREAARQSRRAGTADVICRAGGRPRCWRTHRCLHAC